MLYRKYKVITGSKDFINKLDKNYLSQENYFLKNTLISSETSNSFTYYFDSKLNQVPILGDLYLLFLTHKEKIRILYS